MSTVDKDQLARDLIGCFPVVDKSDRADAYAIDGPTTAVETLRAAARLMRERAEKATPGPWITDQSEIYSGFQGGPWVAESLKIDDDARTRADADHIASWHPAVALAVADWLDGAAEGFESARDPHAWAEFNGALVVARAYLGGAR